MDGQTNAWGGIVNRHFVILQCLWTPKKLRWDGSLVVMSSPFWKRLDNGGADTISSATIITG
jgi:TRAP-type C4-dicarboxylate transport system substrate-binding protein